MRSISQDSLNIFAHVTQIVIRRHLIEKQIEKQNHTREAHSASRFSILLRTLEDCHIMTHAVLFKTR